MRYSPEPLSSQADAARTAADFGALFGHVLCSTVAKHAQVVVIPVWHEDWTNSSWILGPVDRSNVPTPVELSDGSWLFAAQTLCVRQSRRDGNLWLATLLSTYRWQAGEDDASWLVRWEYEREPQGAYPGSHIHVNAKPEHYESDRKDFPKLHLPAGRITIEDVVSFLIREQGVPPVSSQWEAVLEEASAIFARIQGRGPGP